MRLAIGATLNKEIITSKIISRIILVSFFILSLAFSAHIRIPLPFSPVPITLQTLVVFLCAGFLKEKLATLTTSIYLILGMLGLPVFSLNPCGIFYLFGPTGGYLLGFVLASFLVGKLISLFKDRNFLLLFLFMLWGELVILGFGCLWLKFVLNLTFKKAFLLGAIPFLPFDLVKILIAVKIFLKLEPRITKIT